MLCKKCNTDNLLKARYCQHCGNKFDKEEKDAAYGKTVFGKFEKLEEYISYLKPVELIKGNKFFRLAVLVGIIVYCILISNFGGNHIRIEESAEYDLIYNKTQQAYYIVSDDYTVDAKLHIPSSVTTGTGFLLICFQ